MTKTKNEIICPKKLYILSFDSIIFLRFVLLKNIYKDNFLGEKQAKMGYLNLISHLLSVFSNLRSDLWELM